MDVADSRALQAIRAVRASSDSHLRKAIWPDHEVTVNRLDTLADVRSGGTVDDTRTVALEWTSADSFGSA